MEDLRIIQVWIIATLGGVVGIGFLYLRRTEAGPAARLWAWSWLSFFTSLLVGVSPEAWADVLTHVFGTAFPVFLLAGTLAFASRSVPRWLVPAGLLVGVLRGALNEVGATLVKTAWWWS